MDRRWKIGMTGGVMLVAATLACGTLGGAVPGNADQTLQAAGTQISAAATQAAQSQQTGGGQTGGGQAAGAPTATAAEAGGAPTATVAAAGQVTEAATQAPGEPTATPTYDTIAAQLTVPPLLTANAGTATLAAGSMRQWAAAAKASSQYGDSQYAATQATGAPNVTACGDDPSAWASAGNASSSENLQLVYTTPVTPLAVNIYETYSPGSIIQVDVVEAGGTAHTIYKGAPLLVTDCPRVFQVPVTGVDAKVNTVMIYLDESVVKNWDEIDAVELVGNP